jgi:hypothetical protein
MVSECVGERVCEIVGMLLVIGLVLQSEKRLYPESWANCA